jgi:PhzF family phenazine biosynthesis protein
MKLDIYQIDAFSEKVFKGNPAAVIPLEQWLPNNIMQNIAYENNLSETAFFIPAKKGYHIRWFTPKSEVKLCGHATLASAYVIFNILNENSNEIVFDSLSGELSVIKSGNLFILNFPIQKPVRCEVPKKLIEGLGKKPISCYRNEDYLAVYEKQIDISSINPDFNILKQLDLRGVIITAPGIECDFVSRFFVPKLGIDEDPVTGSAHTQLMPYWSDKLNKIKLEARQISSRGGILYCEQKDDRVLIAGSAVKYLSGTININIE